MLKKVFLTIYILGILLFSGFSDGGKEAVESSQESSPKVLSEAR